MNDNRYLKVKDVNGALRDTKTSAVLFSGSQNKRAKARKNYINKLKKLENENANYEIRINKLEAMLNEIIGKQK